MPEPQTDVLAVEQADDDCRAALVSLLAGVPAGGWALTASPGSVWAGTTTCPPSGGQAVVKVEVKFPANERART